MYHALKLVWLRSKKVYEVEYHSGDHQIVQLVHSGFYVTDNIAAMLGRIVAGKCEWYNGLKDPQKNAIYGWLLTNIK